nr:MAG TPA: hypothetical protein [Caudoviricetes sp.]
MNTKYTLAGFGLTVGLAVAAAAPAPTPTTEPTPKPKATASPKAELKADAQSAPAPTERLARTGATLDGIGVALVALLIGVALVIGGHIIDRRFTK